jgi:haloacetate dehalogenase
MTTTASSGLPDLYPGFDTEFIEGAAGNRIHVRIGGAGPPLVLLHGYPQTHVCWHRIAPDLARTHQLVIADLRGYGASDAPPADAAYATYSKRAMAEDILGVMRKLGHDRFSVIGHDRGARVAYRLALDHPSAVDRLVILDILPTLEVWERLRWAAAISAYHWQFLAQPSPLPEALIGGAPEFYVERTLAGWTREKTLDAFDPQALLHYRVMLRDPARLAAVCEDYRAGASIDRRLDQESRAAGQRIAAPTLVLWGSDYVGKGAADVIDIWRGWASDVRGAEIRSGHFLAEENPAATFAAIAPFLRA